MNVVKQRTSRCAPVLCVLLQTEWDIIEKNRRTVLGAVRVLAKCACMSDDSTHMSSGRGEKTPSVFTPPEEDGSSGLFFARAQPSKNTAVHISMHIGAELFPL